MPAGQEMAAGDLSYLSYLSCCFLCDLCVVFLFPLVNLRVYDCDDDDEDEDEDEWPFITTFIIVIITINITISDNLTSFLLGLWSCVDVSP